MAIDRFPKFKLTELNEYCMQRHKKFRRKRRRNRKAKKQFEEIQARGELSNEKHD